MEFNSLPSEIQLAIFCCLPDASVFKIRRVCKRWNDLINLEFKIKRLRCKQNEELQYYYHNHLDFFFVSTQDFLQSISGDPKFSRVKYLDAFFEPKYAELADVFDFLNSFKWLEETRFDCKAHYRFSENLLPTEIQKKTFVVSLERLEKAKFKLDSSQLKVRVVLSLPNLLQLELHRSLDFSIEQPKKLKTLVTDSLFQGMTADYAQFTSLTRIYTKKAEDVRSISRDFLDKLLSLRELHIGFCEIQLNLPDLPPFSGKAKPKIFYFDFEMDIAQINQANALDQHWPNFFEIEDEDENATLFATQNRHQSIDNNRFVYHMHYNPMVRELNNETELFGVMLRKFYFAYLSINGNVTNENLLLRFIHKSEVKSLSFRATSLSRSFFEKLPEYGSSVTYLNIERETTMSPLSGDFDFIFKFKNITCFYLTDFSLSLNFVARLLEEPRLKLIVFNQSENNYQFEVNRYSSLCFFYIFANELGVSFNSFNQSALDILKILRSKLKTNELCFKQLRLLIDQLKFEKETLEFMMRICVYEQKRSIIYLPKELMLLC